MYDTTSHFAEITTGVYRNGNKEQKALVEVLFGKQNVEFYYEIYFHWYNVIHELGHALIATNSNEHYHPVDEEQLVNDFAVAYWIHYGEKEKLRDLEKIVSTTISKFTRPVSDDVTYVDYAKEKWGKVELYNFNNYGWFQFNCVSESLKKQIGIEFALQQMGGANLKIQRQKKFTYIVDNELSSRVLKDAADVLAEWGMKVPLIKLSFSSDLNTHMCRMLPSE